MFTACQINDDEFILLPRHSMSSHPGPGALPLQILLAFATVNVVIKPKLLWKYKRK